MTSQMNSRFAYIFAFAIALAAMIAVASSVGAGNGQQTATALEGPAMDVSVLMASVEIASLPNLTVNEPF
jgi:hypothetical protein